MLFINKLKNWIKNWNNPSMPPSKKFIIESEQQIQTVRPSGYSNKSGFKIEAITRPKQCRVCKTENKITRLPSNQWECTRCGYTWN